MLRVNIHIFGLTKLDAQYAVKMLLFFSILLLCSFIRLTELFQVKNGLTKSLPFFFENAKIWVGRTTLNGEKKEDGLPIA